MIDMAIHFGHYVNKLVDEKGMTRAEFARRLKYHPNSIPSMMQRKGWNTELIDRACAVLNYNIYLDKAKEMAALLDPSGVSEPVVPYESERWKAKYQECKRATDPLIEKVKLLESQLHDKTNLIASQKEMIELLKAKGDTNTKQ